MFTSQELINARKRLMDELFEILNSTSVLHSDTLQKQVADYLNSLSENAKSMKSILETIFIIRHTNIDLDELDSLDPEKNYYEENEKSDES
jgi:hypothetical protein